MSGDRIKKLYYSIGEVSEITGLEQHVLRYWETEFEELRPRKNRAGRRVYTEEDIAMVRRVQHLLKDEKYTIEGARQALQRGADEPGPARGIDEAFRSELERVRAFLQELLDSLERASGGARR